jgi:hypothetical protein
MYSFQKLMILEQFFLKKQKLQLMWTYENMVKF